MVKKKPVKEKKLTEVDFILMGMDHGHVMMEQALDTAETQEQIFNQMTYIKGIALGILANVMINEAAEPQEDGSIKVNPSKAQSCINDLQEEIRFCYDHMTKDLSDIQKYEVKGKKK